MTSALRQLFEDKCAYCELDFGDALDVEHFRPKGKVEDEPAHRGYWWLALQWNNLLPSCVGCNQRRSQHLVTENTTEAEYASFRRKKPGMTAGKGNHFPISGTRAFDVGDSLPDEVHDILDPTVDDPDRYLKWSTTSSFSVVLPSHAEGSLSKRALATINVFALNRVKLVQSRTGVLRELKFQASEIERDLEEDAIQGGSDFAIQKATRRVAALERFCEPDKPFTAMARAFVKEFSIHLLGRIGVMADGGHAPGDAQPHQPAL
ncbi:MULTISPECIES: HNH endonuclease family protein [Rhizobium]|uniref:hypothetical protein n=1 Tax=Rhizobium TaxID=379 RepID=UPI00102FF6C1|nr:MULTISPECIES: hypothetical protein [Rhizobium]TBA34775.1 hypothetical protein ELH63_29815 [Rhizobium ruizarguesonis]WSH10208.1 hypothetical protein U8P72_11930 [Rhizobium johnstonii]